MSKESRKLIAKNSKAFHDYFVEDRYEAGIELAGTEVKSIRMGNVNLKDSFCTIKDGQMTLNGMHVSPYEKGNIFNREPRRPRRLLMHKREILPPLRQGQAGRLHAGPPEPSTSKAPGSRWRSACARAKSSTTSGRPRPRRTPSGRWTGP